MLTGVDHIQIAIPLAREAECIKFYRSVLGLTEVPKPPELRGRGGAWFQLGALQIHLGLEHDESPPSRRHIAFLAPDLPAARAHIAAHGLPTDEGTSIGGVPRFFITDPAGNRIEIQATA